MQPPPGSPLPASPEHEADRPAPFAGASSQIDSTVARAVFGEDTELLVSLSHRLLRDFAELALPGNVQPHDAAALAQLLPRLHKLSGGAGMIGATTIHRLAEAAGAALAGGQAPARVETLLRQLAAAFTALREELAARSLELQSTSE